MFGPTPKYHNIAKDPIDNVPLIWHAHPGGYPIRRGDSPPLIEKERMNYAGENLYARSQYFKIPSEIAEYNKCIDWIANTGGVIRFEERIPDKDGAGWLVWLSWLDIRGYIPNDQQMADLRR